MRVRREGVSLGSSRSASLPAAEFPVSLSSDRARDVSVFDATGTALALNHSAYVGANVASPTAGERDARKRRGQRARRLEEANAVFRCSGLATRIGDSNLYAAVEAKTPLSRQAVHHAWIYLALGRARRHRDELGSLHRSGAPTACGSSKMPRLQVETLRRLMSEAPKVAPVVLSDAPIAASELPQMDFVERPAEAATIDAAPVARAGSYRSTPG